MDDTQNRDYDWWGVCSGCGREPGNGMDGRGEGGEQHEPDCPVAAKEKRAREQSPPQT